MSQISVSEGSVVLLKPEEVAERLRISVRKLWKLAAEGNFPGAVRVGVRSKRWREADVANYINGLPTEGEVR